MLRRTLIGALALGLIVGPAAAGQHRPTAKPTPRPDLADTAAGTYFGNVMSDARGSGQSDVTITVTKTGPNTVSVSSSYARLPSFTTRLTRAMETIQQTGQTDPRLMVFLLDLSKTPHNLHVTIDDAAWSGERQ